MGIVQAFALISFLLVCSFIWAFGSHFWFGVPPFEAGLSIFVIWIPFIDTLNSCLKGATQIE